MSQASASDRPAPAAAPSTAAITGFGQSRTARIRSCRPSSLARRCFHGQLAALGQLAQIATGTEMPAFAGQARPRPMLASAAASASAVGDGRIELGRQRVARGHVVVGEDEHIPLATNQQCIVHRMSPRLVVVVGGCRGGRPGAQRPVAGTQTAWLSAMKRARWWSSSPNWWSIMTRRLA